VWKPRQSGRGSESSTYTSSNVSFLPIQLGILVKRPFFLRVDKKGKVRDCIRIVALVGMRGTMSIHSTELVREEVKPFHVARSVFDS
jgi:hypothetical protein